MQGGRLRLQKFSYRFAEQVLNSKLALKEEIERTLTEEIADFGLLSRPGFNKLLDERFVTKGWTRQPAVFQDAEELGAKMDFLKERIGIEVGFGHASFLGIDLLKFQVSSYSALDKIDVGVYVATTGGFQRRMKSEFKQNWEGSLTFEKIVRYLPHFKSAIQVPICVIGIDASWRHPLQLPCSHFPDQNFAENVHSADLAVSRFPAINEGSTAHTWNARAYQVFSGICESGTGETFHRCLEDVWRSARSNFSGFRVYQACTRQGP